MTTLLHSCTLHSELTHIDNIEIGDCIYIDGFWKTVCKHNIGHDEILGKTLWGDSFKSGSVPVQRALFPKYYQGKFVGYR